MKTQTLKTKIKMKKSVLLALMVAFGLGLSAQTDTTMRKKIEIQIEENTLSFDANEDMSQKDLASMIGFATQQVAKLQANHQRIIQRIEAQREAGKLSDEEADELLDKAEESFDASMETFEDLMENWGEAYGERMEAWAERYEESMEAWAEEMEAQEGDSAVMHKAPPMPPMPPMPEAAPQDSGKKKIIISKKGVIIGDEEIIIEEEEDEDVEFDARDFFNRGEKSKSKSISRTEDYFDIGFGFNQQLEDGQYLVENGPGVLDFWNSSSFNMGIGYKTRLGNPYSKWYFKYGIDFSWHTFALNDDNILETDADSSFYSTNGPATSYDKNEYGIAYFNIPLMLQLDFSEAGDRDESWTVGVGGYGGIRLRAKRELEYSTNVYKNVEQDVRDDFFTNQFRYGLMAQVGYGAFKVTASYDLNEFFQANKGPDTYNMLNVGIGFTF